MKCKHVLSVLATTALSSSIVVALPAVAEQTDPSTMQAAAAPANNGDVSVSSLEQSYVEGSQMFQWHGQKHHVLVDNGALRHAWTVGDRFYDIPLGESGYVGNPVAFVWLNEQHYFARTENGALKHHWWTPEGGAWRDDLWVESGVKGDPAGGVMAGQQHLFYVDTDNKLQHVWQGSDRGPLSRDCWTDRAETDGAPALKVKGRPSVFDWHGQQHVFIRTMDNDVAHFWWDASDNKIHYNKWGHEKAMADVAAMATNDIQMLYFVNEQGRLKRHAWHRFAGVLATEDWSKDGVSVTEAAVTGRPQVFADGEMHHAFAARNDGSVRHYFRDPGQDIQHDTWIPAGTATHQISGGMLHGEQTLFIVQRKGSRTRHWWKPSQDGVKSANFGRSISKRITTLDKITETRLNHIATKGGQYNYLNAAYPSSKARGFVSSEPHHFPEGFTTTTVGTTSNDEASGRIMWETKGGKIALGGVNQNGEFYHATEATSGAADFKSPWTLSLIEATGGIAATNVGSSESPMNFLVATTKDGVVSAQTDGTQKIRWQNLLLDPNIGTSLAIEKFDDQSAKVAALTKSGRVKIAQVDEYQNITLGWATLPELPSQKPAVGNIALTINSSSMHIAAADESGQVFVITLEPGLTTGEWTAVGKKKITGELDILSVKNRGLVVAARDEDHKAMYSVRPHNGEFSEFVHARPKVGDYVVLHSDPLLVAAPSEAKMEWVILGSDEDGRPQAAYRQGGW